jgi:hypothetical protein
MCVFEYLIPLLMNNHIITLAVNPVHSIFAFVIIAAVIFGSYVTTGNSKSLAGPKNVFMER